MANWLSVYLKGFLMGTADAVPGVSGGTIALITGIYDRLIAAIAGLSTDGPGVVADLRGVADPAGRKRFLDSLFSADVPFLFVLGLGVLSGALTLANLLDVALESYRAPTFAFFFGLIAASPVVLRDEASLRAPASAAAGLVGFIVAFALSGAAGPALPDGPVVLFLIGAVAVCAMVLPGLSGSLILLILGKLEVMTGAVSEFTDGLGGLLGGGSVDAVVDPATTLVVFAAGAFVGVLSFARVVSWALERHRVATMTFLLGLLVGALRKPTIEMLDHGGPWTPTTVGLLVVLASLGAAAVLVLGRMTGSVDA